MLARMQDGGHRFGALAAVGCAVIVAGCLGQGGGGEASVTLTFSVDPFNATIPYRVLLPIPMVGGTEHPLIASLRLQTGRANWTLETVDGARTLVVVGVGAATVSATASGGDATAPMNQGNLNWTHSHLPDRNDTRRWGDPQGERDASASAALPLVLTVRASLDGGGGWCGSTNGAGGTLRANGTWTGMPATVQAWCA